MKCGSTANQTQGEQTASAISQVDVLSPHQIAQWIRNLDSQLLSIVAEWDDETLVLCYTFVVAGKVHTFCTKVTTGSLFSIVDLYPTALAFEAAVEQQWGVAFQPYTAILDENS